MLIIFQTTLQTKHQAYGYAYQLKTTLNRLRVSRRMQSLRSTSRPSSPSAVRATVAGRSRPSSVDVLQRSAVGRRSSSPSFVTTLSAVQNGMSTRSPPRAAFMKEPATPSTLGLSDASVGSHGKSPDSSIRTSLKRVGLGRTESSNPDQKKQRSENIEAPNILQVKWDDIEELKSIASIQFASSDVASDIEELVWQVLQNYPPQHILCAAMKMSKDITDIPNSRKDKEALVIEYVKSLYEHKAEENKCMLSSSEHLK